jgi:hypothetical protein
MKQTMKKRKIKGLRKKGMFATEKRKPILVKLICKRCHEKWRAYYCRPKWGIEEDYQWRHGSVWCLPQSESDALTMLALTYKQPPEHCPFSIEHFISLKA